MKLIKIGDDYYNPDKVIGLFRVNDGFNLIMDGDGENVWHIKINIDKGARILQEKEQADENS